MAFKIYTKTGDKGKTSLFGGARLPKHHLRIEAYGTADELNSHIGLLRDYLKHWQMRDWLLQIQDRLFVLGSNLALDPSSKLTVPQLNENDVQYLEQAIDQMEVDLEPLKTFILPGGHVHSSQAHICRCVCRRAERLVVALSEAEENVAPILVQYLNRLSDFLFVLARYISKENGVREIPWTGR